MPQGGVLAKLWIKTQHYVSLIGNSPNFYCVTGTPAAAAQVEKRNVNKHGLTVLSGAGGGGGQQGKYALLRLRQTSLYLGKLTYLTNVAIINTSVILYTIYRKIITCNRIVADVSLEEI